MWMILHLKLVLSLFSMSSVYLPAQDASEDVAEDPVLAISSVFVTTTLHIM